MITKGKVFVVSGAGSGIGRALVLDLLKRGSEVAAVDINDETLQQTKELAGELGKNMSTHIVNIADRQLVEELPEKVIQKHGKIDGIINNAGIIQPFVRVNDLDYSAIERVINVNLWGTIFMTKAFLPELLKRPEAHIANVSSMGGFFPFPGQTIYGTAKAGVKIFTEGLHSELSDTGVRVSVIFPGAIATNISANSGLEQPAEADSGSSGMKALPPEEAAKIIIDGIEKNKYQILVGSDAKMMDFLYRINPKRAVGFISKQMKGLLAD